MSQSDTAPNAPTTGDDPADRRARARAVQLMMLGGVLAVLGPLAGFLVGSMIGPAQEVGDYNAMFVSMFAGLVLGGVGAVVAGLALLRFVRHHGRLY